MKINKNWHKKNKMPNNPALEERIKWHLEHAKKCACRPIPESLLLIINKEKPINPYFLGAQFLKYCAKQGWLKQDGTGGRGTKWYVTAKGKTVLEEKFNIEI